MKKIILALLALPLVLVACSKKEDDINLYGTWEGQVKTSDLDLLNSAGQSGALLNPAIATETLYYKFDDGKISMIRSKDYDVESNQIEQSVGTYKAKKNTLDIKIVEHSCANVDEVTDKGIIVSDSKKRTDIRATYHVSTVDSTMTIDLGINKTVTFTKLTSDQAKKLDYQAAQADVGCYGKDKGNPAKTKFKKNPVQAPKKPNLDLEAARAQQPETTEQKVEN